MSRGSFARKEKPGGEGARPGRRFLQGSSKCSQQSPNATSRPAAPLRLGPRRVIGTTELFWGGMQDLRDSPTPLGRHRLAPALPYVPGGGQSSVTRHIGGTGTRDTCAWFQAPIVCLSPLPCLDRWSGHLVLAAPPCGLWAPFGVQDQAAGPSLLLGVQHQVLLPLCLHHLVELHGGSGVLHRGVTILPDLLGTKTGCGHSPRHHSDTG